MANAPKPRSAFSGSNPAIMIAVFIGVIVLGVGGGYAAAAISMQMKSSDNSVAISSIVPSESGDATSGGLFGGKADQGDIPTSEVYSDLSELEKALEELEKELGSFDQHIQPDSDPLVVDIRLDNL